MKPDLRIVVQPAGRAATVSNARLQAMRIVPLTCETHGSLTCSCLDRRARQHEGSIPESYTGAEITLDHHGEGFALLLWAVVCTGALVTGYSLGGLFAEWLIG